MLAKAKPSRNTLTLDPDVARGLERLRLSGNASFKDVVNETLRLGIPLMEARHKPQAPFRIEPMDLGELLMPGRTPKEILLELDEEYFQKKLSPK